MAKMRAVDAAVYVLEKEGLIAPSAYPARRSIHSTRPSGRAIDPSHPRSPRRGARTWRRAYTRGQARQYPVSA